MKGKVILSLLGVAAGVTLALVLLLATGGSTGEYHTGTGLVCYDCHTMHFSMQHGWQGGPVGVGRPPVGGVSGDWLGATGPNELLLKLPENQLCLSCHDGTAGAPDVLGLNANAAPSQGREAGALNQVGGVNTYQTWMGHTLGTTDRPPGYNPTLVGATDPFPTGEALSCVECHTVHGAVGVYRNVRARSVAVSANFRPTYVLGTTNDASKDVWITNAGTGTVGQRNAAGFNPYYDTANIFFNRNDGTVGTLATSNRMSNFCAACHANFHGGEGNPNISNADFIRHPTASMGLPTSYLNRYRGNVNKVKVTSSSQQAGNWNDASPFCLTCHKGHGNQNAFGLMFLSGATGAAYTEEGSTTDTANGIRNLCRQCHSQGTP